MTLPPADTPLYNHSLPAIETWLRDQGCEQNPQDRNCWLLAKNQWTAELCLDIEEVAVRYQAVGRNTGDVVRSFKYSLSRQDMEAAIFAGP